MDAVGQVQDVATSQCGLSQGRPSGDQAMCVRRLAIKPRIRILESIGATRTEMGTSRWPGLRILLCQRPWEHVLLCRYAALREAVLEQNREVV